MRIKPPGASTMRILTIAVAAMLATLVTSAAAPPLTASPSASPSPAPSAAPKTATTGPQLSIAVTDKRASASAGSTLDYATTVHNLGTGPAVHLVVTQTVPSGAKLTSSDSGGAATPGKVMWTVTLKADGQATVRAAMSVSATPKDLLRLATVACASATATSPPIVCASDLDQLPDGSSATADTTGAKAAGKHSSDTNAWWYAGGGVGVVALAAFATAVWSRRRSSSQATDA